MSARSPLSALEADIDKYFLFDFSEHGGCYPCVLLDAERNRQTAYSVNGATPGKRYSFPRVCPCRLDRPSASPVSSSGNAGGQVAVGRTVMLEPFLRHIFPVFDNSRHISTSPVRDHLIWNPEIAVADLAGGYLCSFPCTQPVRDGSIWRQGISRR
jgi:hypothetical protein